MCEECEKVYISFIEHRELPPNEVPGNIFNGYYVYGTVQTLNSGMHFLKPKIKEEVNEYLAKIFADEDNFRRK